MRSVNLLLSRERGIRRAQGGKFSISGTLSLVTNNQPGRYTQHNMVAFRFHERAHAHVPRRAPTSHSPGFLISFIASIACGLARWKFWTVCSLPFPSSSRPRRYGRIAFHGRNTPTRAKSTRELKRIHAVLHSRRVPWNESSKCIG